MLIEHLKKEFAQRSLRNPRYSLRAYAKSLDVDASTLSALLRNKRPLSAKSAKKLIDALNIEDPMLSRRLFISSFNPYSQTSAFSEIDLKTFDVICSWEHFAILSLLEISTPRADLNWISESLRLPMSTAAEALDRLESLKLVKRSSNVWALSGACLATPSNIPSAALKKNNRQYIEMAVQSLERDSVGDRDITGITMAIDRKKLPEAQKLIKEFRRSLATYLETGTKTSVYRLNIQLYPLSKQRDSQAES
ncbi:MAG TPA: TIGR02147 family protein [Bdellovibrionales bacterium]|nr:TIGR02147 family protein [Bdellovibrionales bacterium]